VRVVRAGDDTGRRTTTEDDMPTQTTIQQTGGNGKASGTTTASTPKTAAAPAAPAAGREGALAPRPLDAEKRRAIDAAVAAIEKQFGKGAIMALGERNAQQVPVIPSGSPSLDAALGCGGYPRGRVVEIYGPESSGKTTLTLHAIAECQRAGGVAAFVDAEHALDVGYAQKLGVDIGALLVSQPDTGEQALEIVETLVRSGAVDLVVVDSVAALVPQAEIEGEMGDAHVGLQARLMSQALRKLTGVAHRTGCTIVFINQLRMKIGVMFGSPETTTGGNALKYYASVRLDVRRIGQVKSGEELVGNRTKVKVVKNKLAPPFAAVEFDIRYGTGIDAVGDLLDLAVARKVVEKSGAYLSFRGECLGQGREKARATLLEDAARREALWAATLAAGPIAGPSNSSGGDDAS
jgi:recombination protein RecA